MSACKKQSNFQNTASSNGRNLNLDLFLRADMMKKDSFKLAISLVAQETNVKLRNLKLKKSSSLVFFSHDLTCAHVKIRFTII